jgi:hypothetical protein
VFFVCQQLLCFFFILASALFFNSRSDLDSIQQFRISGVTGLSLFTFYQFMCAVRANSVRFSYCVCVSRPDEVVFMLVRRSKRLKKRQAPGLSTRWSRPPHRLRKGARLKGFCLENFSHRWSTPRHNSAQYVSRFFPSGQC